jgi:hypothetical protein
VRCLLQEIAVSFIVPSTVLILLAKLNGVFCSSIQRVFSSSFA